MKVDRPTHRSARYEGYDYADVGAYVFTIVVNRRAPMLGQIQAMEFQATNAGEIVRGVWMKLPARFPTIVLDAFVVMPNHVHGIVFLGGNPFGEADAMIGVPTTGLSVVASPFMATDVGEGRGSTLATSSGEADAINGVTTTSPPSRKRRPPTPPSRDPLRPALGEIVRSLKASSTAQIRKEFDPAFSWQPNYWDRIIRNDVELERYRTYIENNPSRWEEDKEYLKGDW